MERTSAAEALAKSLATLTALSPLLLAVALLTGCDAVRCADAHRASPVKTVGGCDHNGYCGVVLEDGTYILDAYEPVVGVSPRGGRCAGGQGQY